MSETDLHGNNESGASSRLRRSRILLASLAAGDSAEEILADFPSLKPEDVQAAIAFAAASAEEDLPVPEIPHIR